jgi:hypothetical protein
MSQQNNVHGETSTEEDLSDYRLFLSCMRKRLEIYGMLEALDRLERLDSAIMRAIAERRPRPVLKIVA